MKVYPTAFNATAARLFAVITIAALLMSALPVQFYTAAAEGSTEGPQSVSIKFVKKFDGETKGFTPDQFSFLVTGEGGFSELLAHNEEFDFTAGDFTVEEIAPAEFNQDYWRIKWTCPDVHMSYSPNSDHEATFAVTSDNYRDGALFCTAENQYRPVCTDPAATNYDETEECVYPPEVCEDEAATNYGEEGACVYPPETCDDETATNYEEAGACEYDNGGGTGEQTGTIVIVKEVTASSSTSTPFTFDPSWGNDFVLLAGESTSTERATGTYSISEILPTGWNTPEISCVSSNQDTESAATLELDADETITCTFVNDERNDGGSGNTGDTFIIEGYVWHDDNENDIWDGFEDEEATTTEESLTGWTVRITDGDTTLSTLSDETGYYSFEVSAGTWTITEVVMAGWKQTAPNSGSYVVTAPEVVAASLADRVFAMLVPTAHAAVIATYGPYNFGNNQNPITPTSSGGSSSGGGGSSSPRCDVFTVIQENDDLTLTWETRRGNELTIEADGTEIYTEDDDDIVDEGSITIDNDGQEDFELTVSRGSRSDSCEVSLSDGQGGTPTPQILGEQVSVVPQGAPDAGVGGSSTTNLTTLVSGLFRRLLAW